MKTTLDLNATNPDFLELVDYRSLQEEIRELAKEKDAIILAHNYQLREVQDIADYTGDSLGLAHKAAAVDNKRIIFCGVHFMAETAAITCPDKTVHLPDLNAGCSLADSITAQQLRDWKAKYPNAIVVMYVNTTAEVKAETDYCCTSGNAVKVVEHIYNKYGSDQEILFGPDMFLGAAIEKELGVSMHVWDGECHVHAGIKPQDLTDLKEENPDAQLLAHFECSCFSTVYEMRANGDIPADTPLLSTSQMIDYAKESDYNKFIVGTETGMLYPLEKAVPDKEFIPANRKAFCKYMKMITLPKIKETLINCDNIVSVDKEIADKAKLSINRMLEIS